MPSLNLHSRKYNISAKDSALLILTGFTGAPYAKRHWDLAKNSSTPNRLGHRLIAAAECVPILGGVIAGIERAVDAIKQRGKKESIPPSTPKAKQLSIPSAGSILETPHSSVVEDVAIDENDPAHMAALKTNNQLHLLKHLKDNRTMRARNDREAAAQTASFSTISHVVLETRAAIIERVEKYLETQADNPELLFLLGGTGSGKSTTYCFLRGDEMVRKDVKFESKNDAENAISHSLTESCTFLPNLQRNGNLVLIDYPGFDDSNGPLVNLGIELALKDLLKRHPSKILVVESVTNTEGRYANIDKRGAQLSRILGDKSNCLVGLTKYTSEHHYFEIEKLQKKLKEPSPEEVAASSSLATLNKLLADQADLTQEQKERILDKIEYQKERLAEAAQNREADDGKIREEIKRHEEAIEKTEELICKHIGINSLVRFDDLLDPQAAQNILDRASSDEVKPVLANPELKFDSNTEQLLLNRLENELLEKLHAMHLIEHCENGEELVRNAVDHGLICTITGQDSAINQFLNLPEFDPELATKFDKILITRTLEKEIDAACALFNFDQLNNSSLEEPRNNLVKLILGLKGTVPDTPEMQRREWNKLHASHRHQKQHKPPKWATEALQIPAHGPRGLLKLTQEQGEPSPELLQLCADELTQISTLIRLLTRIQFELNRSG